MLLGHSGACASLSRWLAGTLKSDGYTGSRSEWFMSRSCQCICKWFGTGLEGSGARSLSLSACLSSQVPSEYPDPTSKPLLLPAQANPLRTTRSSGPHEYHNPNIIHYHNSNPSTDWGIDNIIRRRGAVSGISRNSAILLHRCRSRSRCCVVAAYRSLLNTLARWLHFFFYL